MWEAARAAVGAAQTALTAAADLPMDVADNLGTLVSSLDSRLGGIETARMDTGPSEEAQAEAMSVAMAIARDGMDMSSIALLAGLEADPFAVGGGKVTERPVTPDEDSDDFAKSADAAVAIVDRAGSMYTHVMEDDAGTMNLDESATTTVVVYTDIEDPADEAYSVYYSEAAAPGRDAVEAADADGVLSLTEDDIEGNHELFMGDFGITAPHQTIPGPADDGDTEDVDEAEVSIMGSFNGIPGTFACVETCSRSSDEDGNLSGFGGTWTFTPAEQEMGDDPYMVVGVIDDTDYLDFGYWKVEGTDQDGDATLTVGTFARGEMQHVRLDDVVGTASYTGAATGLYMKKTFDQDGDVTPVSSGPVHG